MRRLLLWILPLMVLAGCGVEMPFGAQAPSNGADPTLDSRASSGVASRRTLPATSTPLYTRIAPAIPPTDTATLPPTGTATPLPSDTPSPTATSTPTPEPTDAPWRSLLGDNGAYYWALIGDSTDYLQAEREAGIEAKVFSLNWRLYEIADGVWDQRYIARKLDDYRQVREAGMEVILSLGYHDPPDWIHPIYGDSHYINQYGVSYDNQGQIDGGDLNLVWNQDLRALVERYVAHVFANFGTDFAAVRLGGGRFGELSYPPADFAGQGNAYWAYDANAQASCPVPGWRPGDPSPNDEAARFLDWYLDSLVSFQNWQIDMVRAMYEGPLMILYPSWGLRPGDIELALATGLDGSSPPERNGEVQRGYDFAGQVAALSDPNLILTTTWLDADLYPGQEMGDDARFWSPARYLAHLAADHPLELGLFGENTGQGSEEDMVLSARRMQENNFLGMAWYRESELFSPEYASLDGYRAVIENTEEGEEPAG